MCKKTFLHALSLGLLLIIFLTSCTKTYYSHSVRAVPESTRTINVWEELHTKKLPTRDSPDVELQLTTLFEKERKTEHVTTEHLDNSETRIGGFCTILIGGLTALMVAAGIYDEDTGTRSDPNPEAAKTIFAISGLFGLVLTMVPDSEKESVDTRVSKFVDEENTADGATYLVWPESLSGRSILRSVENGVLSFDVLKDFKLDYFENQEQVDLHLLSIEDTSKTYSITLELSDWLTKTLIIQDDTNAIARYAASFSAPMAYILAAGARLDPLKKVGEWYKVRENDEIAYVHEQYVDFYYAMD